VNAAANGRSALDVIQFAAGSDPDDIRSLEVIPRFGDPDGGR
jgi:hypothetical protein